jgi:hypothetical protein
MTTCKVVFVGWFEIPTATALASRPEHEIAYGFGADTVALISELVGVVPLGTDANMTPLRVKGPKVF